MQLRSSREMERPSTSTVSSSGLQDHIPNPNQQQQHFEHSRNDDFFDQMLSDLPSWPDLSQENPNSPWDLAGRSPSSTDESILLASRLRQHQISGGKEDTLQLSPRQHLLLSPMARAGDPGLIRLPLSLGSNGSCGDSADIDMNKFSAQNPPGGDGIYNGFGSTLQRVAPIAAAVGGQQHFSLPQREGQSSGTPATGMGQSQSDSGASGETATGGGTAPPRQRVRARRGQATDPHSIAERLRRERIADRMKALQELVPNANKTDKASMLDEIIGYVKFLQLQVKALSMSRLGGAAAVAPLVADMSSESPFGRTLLETGSGGSNGLAEAEHQVAQLMEEDVGSAMQYLHRKGLCLMPISLASTISTASSHPQMPVSPAIGTNNHLGLAGMDHYHQSDGPTSPSVSVLTVQSTMAANNGDGPWPPPAKDGALSH